MEGKNGNQEFHLKTRLNLIITKSCLTLSIECILVALDLRGGIFISQIYQKLPVSVYWQLRLQERWQDLLSTISCPRLGKGNINTSQQTGTHFN